MDIPASGLLACLQAGLSGLILFTLGLMGDYLSRIYDEVKQRPLYIVRELINLPGTQSLPRTQMRTVAPPLPQPWANAPVIYPCPGEKEEVLNEE